MTPSRTRKPVTNIRSRSEVVVAVVVGVGIVACTLLLIWLLRPAVAGRPGTGGLLTRQSRAGLLLVVTGLAIWAMVAWLLHGRHRPRRYPPKVTIPIGVGLVLLVAVIAAVAWPGGLIRHWPAQPDLADVSDVEAPTVTTPVPTGDTVEGETPASTPTPDSPASTAG